MCCTHRISALAEDAVAAAYSERNDEIRREQHGPLPLRKHRLPYLSHNASISSPLRVELTRPAPKSQVGAGMSLPLLGLVASALALLVARTTALDTFLHLLQELM